MKIQGFELKERTAYQEELTNNLGESVVVYAKIVYDSISNNWNWLERVWYRWKYSPSKILKNNKTRSILEAVKYIYNLEGKKEKYYTFLRYQLNEISEDEFNKWSDEMFELAKRNKKKVDDFKNIEK